MTTDQVVIAYPVDVFARIIPACARRLKPCLTDVIRLCAHQMARDLKEAAEISMGTEITIIDIVSIKALADQVSAFLRCLFYSFIKGVAGASPLCCVLLFYLNGLCLYVCSRRSS